MRVFQEVAVLFDGQHVCYMTDHQFLEAAGRNQLPLLVHGMTKVWIVFQSSMTVGYEKFYHSVHHGCSGDAP